MRLNEVKKVVRTGLIPYYYDSNGTLRMYFMTPSDPKYGGPDPQIAKGQIDKGENKKEAAIREAEEELGLVQDNIKSIFKAFNGKPFNVYAALIDDPKNFTKPHFETGSTHWFTLDEFEKVGRDFQKSIVTHVVAKIKEQK